MKILWWGILGITVIGISGAYIHQSLTRRTSESELAVLGDVQPFHLQDQANQPFSLANLKGKTWVADFIYTSCPDQCPMMSRHMQVIQGLLPSDAAVELVSITIDPHKDSPAVLARYAQKYHADGKRWHFLTGPMTAVKSVVDNFKLLAPPDKPGRPSINHSNRLVLVDAKAQIRGYYDGTDQQEVQKLVKDLSQL
jgi:protein SCO1/2